jgi:hypothetical protein
VTPSLLRPGLLAFALLLPGAEGTPDQEFRQRQVEYRRSLASSCLRFGAWCRARDLHLSARELDEAAVRLDPTLEEPRKRLGHRRGPGGWEAPSGPLPQLRDLWHQERARLYVRERQVAIEASAESARSFARWCAGAGLEKEARGAWYDLIGYLPGDAEAREALSLGVLNPDPLSRPLRSEKDRTAWLQNVSRPLVDYWLPVEMRRQGILPTRWRSAFKPAPDQAASASFIVETTRKDTALFALNHCHRSLEAVRALGFKPSPENEARKPLSLLLLEDRGNYETLVNSLFAGDPARRTFHLGLSGFYAGAREYVSLDTREFQYAETVTHKVAEHEASALMGGDGPDALSEGMALLAAQVTGAYSFRRCVARATTAADSPEIADPQSWGAKVLEANASGRDHGIPDLLAMKINDMDELALLEGWSLLWFLREVDPVRATDFLARVGTTRDPEGAALDSFGVPSAALQRAWKDWIRAQWAPLTVRR